MAAFDVGSVHVSPVIIVRVPLVESVKSPVTNTLFPAATTSAVVMFLASSVILEFVGHAAAPPPFGRMFVFKIPPIVKVVVAVAHTTPPPVPPVTVNGSAYPTRFAALPEDGVPSTGVTNVGDVQELPPAQSVPLAVGNVVVTVDVAAPGVKTVKPLALPIEERVSVPLLVPATPSTGVAVKATADALVAAGIVPAAIVIMLSVTTLAAFVQNGNPVAAAPGRFSR